MEDKITITMTYDEAEKISIAIHNLFIQDFFDVSMALGDLYDMKALMELNHRMITLKASIDQAMDEQAQ